MSTPAVPAPQQDQQLTFRRALPALGYTTAAGFGATATAISTLVLGFNVGAGHGLDPERAAGTIFALAYFLVALVSLLKEIRDL